VVKRFDRLPGANGWRRVHQEDICQATSVLPWNKYENEGGPGIPAIVDLLQEHSISPEIDQGRFLDMIGLNWVLAATDAHAKNYALLHLPGGGIRLAPFYDIASYLPYADQRLHEIRMAMRVGHEYEIRKVSLKDWKALAAAAGLSPDYVVDRLMGLLPRIPDAVQMAASRAVRDGLDQQIVQDLTTRIVRHCTDCLKRIRLGLTAA
jgi:serine/threonine-protein kinase HipA